MNILITSFYYYPELTPRAFRTHELVKDFCSQGHGVTLYLPNKAVFKHADTQISNLEIKFLDNSEAGIGENNVNSDNNKLSANTKRQKWVYKFAKQFISQQFKNKIKSFREWMASYLFPIHRKSFIYHLANSLKKEKKNYNLIISIGLPVEVHIGTAIGILINRNLSKVPAKVADYGDPFSMGGTFKGYVLVDFFIGITFKYISVPTEIAVSSYRLFKKKKNIKVIPQGFNLNEYQTASYFPNPKPTFAYAGCFYQAAMRDDSVFFEKLLNVNSDYQFFIYTIKESRASINLINQYHDKLTHRLKVYFDVPREKLIHDLSKMDFLVNLNYRVISRLPSKLIDYAIAKRPICNLSTTNLEIEKLKNFLNGDYSENYKIDLQKYDIKTVANQFINLVN